MTQIRSASARYFWDLVGAWDRFWFTPVDPATLSLVRILAGAMLFYTHLVWSLDLEAFFGADGWLSPELMAEAQQGRYTWSYFWYLQSPALLWGVHGAGLLVFLLLTLGWKSRLMSVLAYVVAVSYTGRIVPGAFFGLDKINCMLAMYLMLGPSGARYSLDAWLARRRREGEGGSEFQADQDPRENAPSPEVSPSVGANVAIRMIQLHMCIIYLFSGLEKLLGVTWWDGSAVWLAAANLEYQTLDLTWLANWPRLTALLTHITVFWELFYVALVWPRLTRPIVLLIAVAVHGGIAIALGLMTFGLVMLIGNLAFVPSELVRRVLERAHTSS